MLGGPFVLPNPIKPVLASELCPILSRVQVEEFFVLEKTKPYRKNNPPQHLVLVKIKYHGYFITWTPDSLPKRGKDVFMDALGSFYFTEKGSCNGLNDKVGRHNYKLIRG